jgi:SAM-dependent methyltransferase
MTQGLTFGEEEARRIEAVYRSGDAIRRRKAVMRSLNLSSGERVVDIGTGPGFVALEMSEQVGPTGRVLAIDRSEAMLALAQKRTEGVPGIEVRHGDAVALPCGDGEFDAGVSVQVYEYVQDIEGAISEMFRVLKPGGRAAIVATDWDSILWHAGDMNRMARVLSAFEEHLHDPRLPRKLTPLLRRCGFELRDREVIVQFNPEFKEDTYSVGLIPLVAGFVAGRRGVSSDEAADWAADLRALGERGEYFFCLNQFLFAVTKPARS